MKKVIIIILIVSIFLIEGYCMIDLTNKGLKEYNQCLIDSGKKLQSQNEQWRYTFRKDTIYLDGGRGLNVMTQYDFTLSLTENGCRAKAQYDTLKIMKIK